MKKNNHIKIIAALLMAVSWGAQAGIGGLKVESKLGEPFSGVVTVNGEEARALIEGAKVNVSDKRLSVRTKTAGDKVVVSLRSDKAIDDPVVVFQLGVGRQTRQYTAIIDPPGYQAENDAKSKNTDKASVAVAAKNNKVRTQPSRSTKTQKSSAQSRKAGNGSQHIIRSGETLTSIAKRVNPGNLSTYQTIQVLVQANPELFQNGSADAIWPGEVLNIPPRNEMKRIAKALSAAPKSVETTPEREAVTQDKAVDNTAAENNTVAASPVASVEPVVPSEKDLATQTAETKETSSTQSASETQATASGVTTSSEPATAPADAASAALPAEQAASEQASAEVVTTTEQVSETTEQEDGGFSWRWLLLGGLAALVLWLIAKNRRRTSAEPLAPVEKSVAQENNGYEIRTEQPPVQPKGKAATPAASSDLQVEDDFEDDIFFTEVEPVKSENNQIDLDISKIDTRQSGIVSGAVTHDEETEKRRNANWDTIESTESVYEPEDLSFKPVHVSTDRPADTKASSVSVDTPDSENFIAKTVAEPVASAAEVPEHWAKSTESTNLTVQDQADLAAEADNSVIEWDDNVQVDSRAGEGSVGFMSESVGMTAPLEAKYELAKMYIEIGDPEAARETLNELLEESDGNILAKAKQLLEELDA